jgi:hypothetical protein
MSGGVVAAGWAGRAKQGIARHQNFLLQMLLACKSLDIFVHYPSKICPIRAKRGTSRSPPE